MAAKTELFRRCKFKNCFLTPINQIKSCCGLVRIAPTIGSEKTDGGVTIVFNSCQSHGNSSVDILYFIFTSFWAYKIYYVYGFMLLVFIILMIVTVCVTIVCTYFLLNAEDYRWQWTSFLAAASTSAYVYVYAFLLFLLQNQVDFVRNSLYLSLVVFEIVFEKQTRFQLFKCGQISLNHKNYKPAVWTFRFSTNCTIFFAMDKMMYGLFQTAFYFGHMALFSGVLGIICGTVGYIGTSIFVRKIYSTVKID
ncbi:hypothetical protein NQ317_019158 [Molorchus minor]|uniref:Transmembrane 9 superfamily member n=1 Tax=Molorchus minor TaxID=1323400 RepID=A0ABQ9JPQ3_9CUCU|nr:hypothetical protein NQ317_019158 [Molorchus minor]